MGEWRDPRARPRIESTSVLADRHTFRLFVSSTFGDLGLERDALQRDVFPHLERLCAARGARFVAVDLRWGVNEEAALDQRTLSICLDEVDRSRIAPLRPRFLVLLGERYGWRPLPYEVSAETFDACATTLREAGWNELTAWYELDENARPAVRRLRPRTGRWTQPAAWSEREQCLRELLRTAIGASEELVRSATEHEILRARLEHAQPGDVHCFLRTIDGLPTDERAGSLRDPDPASATRSQALRDRLRGELPAGSVHEVRAAWTTDGLSENHLPDLCDRVRGALTTVIESELDGLRVEDPLAAEIDAHRRFLEERAAHFAGREDELAEVARHLDGTAPQPLYVSGVSGVGKSAFMARAALAAAANARGALVVARCVGATSPSVDTRLLLDGITRELARASGEPDPVMPRTLDDVADALREQLARTAHDRRVILLLDAVDQLSGDAGTALSWLEGPLSSGVRVVVSTLRSPWLDAALAGDPRPPSIELQPLGRDVADALLDAWLADARRALTDRQRDTVRQAFGQHALPLHLRLCFAEAVRWPSMHTPAPLPSTVEGMVDVLLARLGDEREHGAVLVGKTLGFLAAGRGGLAEDELRRVLAADVEVLTELRRRGPRSPVVAGVPPIVLSRLLYDLRPYLNEREAQGATLIGFFHRAIGEAIAERFASGPRALPLHEALARSFAAAVGPRQLSELPHHLTLSRDWEALLATFTDARFLLDKATRLDVTEPVGGIRHHGGVLLLQQDIDAALAHWPPALARGRAALAAVGTALRRETVTLTADPALLVQQVLNRLRTGGQAHAAERLARSAPPGPRLLLRTRMPESEELTGVVQAGDWVYACAVGGRDDDLVVVTAQDSVVRVWNRRSGSMRELRGHTKFANDCAIALDGLVAVSASPDGTVRLWDPSTGRQHLRLEHGAPAQSCALSEDGGLVLSGGDDGALRLWSAATGRALAQIDAHEDSVVACDLDPTGRRAVSAGRSGTVSVWSLPDGGRLAQRQHSEFPVCAITRDGTCVVSGSSTGEVVVWDAETGATRVSLAERGRAVNACAISRDGALVAVASDDASVHVHPLAGGGLHRRLRGHRWSANTCAFGAGADCLVSGDGQGFVRAWDLSQPASTEAQCHTGNVWSGTLALAGTALASAGEDAVVRLIDVASGDESAVLEGHEGWIGECAANAGGDLLVTAGADGTARAWDLVTRRVARAPVRHDSEVQRCAISPDGSVGLSASDDGAVRVWPTRDDEPPRGQDGHSGRVWCAAFSPDSAYAVTGGHDGRVRTWDPRSGGCLTDDARHDGRVIACAVTPDARLVVSGGDDNALVLAAPGDPGSRILLAGHAGAVAACAVSPDGSVVVSGGGDATVRVWDLATGAARLVLECSSGAYVRDVAVSPDAALVAAAGTDRRVWVWDLRTGAEVARIVLPAQLRWVGFHRLQPLVYFGGEGGHAHVAELAGVAYGPLLVTAHGAEAGCPVCRTRLPVASALARELACPDCRRLLRVNAFTLARPDSA